MKFVAIMLYHAYYNSIIMTVIIALTSVAVAPNHPVIKYIDALGCIIVACYLLYTGLEMIRYERIRQDTPTIKLLIIIKDLT